MSAQGFFALTSASDLIAKARSDLDGFRSNPLDSYRAFNFFVTARHVPDWLFPGDEKAKGEVLIKDLVVGAEIAGMSKERDEYLKKQAEAQFSVPEAQLVEAVRKIIEKHKA